MKNRATPFICDSLNAQRIELSAFILFFTLYLTLIGH